jgi:hypothetical protein
MFIGSLEVRPQGIKKDRPFMQYGRGFGSGLTPYGVNGLFFICGGNMACKECVKRGKTWNGSDPVCGFENNKFSSDNWNCASMNQLRDLADASKVYNDDQYCTIIPIPESCDFIVLYWYKSRGRTENAIVITDCGTEPLTINIVEDVLKAYKKDII